MSYKLNLQGDVIGIINTSGTEVVSYTYDAWDAEPAPQAARLSAGQPGRRSGERGYREERREAAGAVARPG